MTNPGGRIVIAGGSGFLGVALAEHLIAGGAEVVILSRNVPRATGDWKHVVWDARALGDWRHELDGANGLVNLTGRSVNCIKSPDHRDEILRSRVESTRVLGRALRTIDSPPPVWVQMSTAHIYGDPPRLICSEDSPFGHGLAPDVGRAWEEEFRESALPNQRRVILRTGFVLGRNRGVGGGALSTLKRLTQFGLGGTVGTGTQGMSWIHELDMNRLFECALFDPNMLGPYISSAPHPISQRELMWELRRAVGMPIGLPATTWMVRFGARWLLNTDPELILYGRYVVSKRLKDFGFVFQFPEIRAALEDLLKRRT